MTSKAPRKPLIVIVGATGTGKSKLAVSLATKYNGEIINGDAVQMYKGLPIVTNKISEKERDGIPHHLIDFIGLDEKPWTVVQFVKESSRIIEEIQARGKLPIVVGGTHYYVDGLLVNNALVGQGENGSEESRVDSENQREYSILERPTEEILAKLREVDPKMAQRWHPNDRRHIQRSLEIWLQTGRKASEIYHEQKQQELSTSDELLHASLRYEPLICWLDAEDATLKERLNARVDTMIENGLLEEVCEMRKFEDSCAEMGKPIDKTFGVWVAIGYKEMEPWLRAQTDAKGNEKGSNQVKESCIEAVKGGTRRYAKRQNRYIRIRLTNKLRSAHSTHAMFLLDCTNLDRWHADVRAPSEALVEAYLSESVLPAPSSVSEFARLTFAQMDQPENSPQKYNAQYCSICQKTLVTEREWIKHLKSRGHKKATDSQKKTHADLGTA